MYFFFLLSFNLHKIKACLLVKDILLLVDQKNIISCPPVFNTDGGRGMSCLYTTEIQWFFFGGGGTQHCARLYKDTKVSHNEMPDLKSLQSSWGDKSNTNN